MRPRTSRGTGGALALLLIATGIAGSGCELVVPDTVPAFSCIPGDPDVCPSDAVCAPTTRQCITRSQACTVQGCPPGLSCDRGTLACGAGSPDGGASTSDGSAGSPDGDTNSPDGGTGSPDGDSFTTNHSLGSHCSGPSDCATGICGDQLTVGSSVFDAAGQASFCTKPCCTSADCDESTICFATAAGGNLCVRPEWLGRATTLGNALGGAQCSSDSNCRSGLCAGASCADTCCSAAEAQAECAPGETCAFGPFPGRTFDTHLTAFCSTPPGIGANGSACANSSQCASGLCAPQTFGMACHDACRNSADCGSSTQECGYSVAMSAVVTVCSASPGTATEGSSCANNGDCQSGFCDSASSQCTDVCFADTDCTVDGWRCRPEVVVLAGASFSFLACGS
jgi:hypothetical protein